MHQVETTKFYSEEGCMTRWRNSLFWQRRY